jgi:RNA polymerase sigma-70 factor (ECF subfamily)
VTDINALLAAMANGDMSAFGKIYDILSIRVFNYARAITHNREVSEDITHDVFIQIYKKAARLVNTTNPVAYIMVTTRNLTYNHLKKLSRTTEYTEEAETMPFDRLLIRDAFSKLPAAQRETLYLQHVCGFTQKEVSKIMGVPLPTVKWRCGKAMSQLREYFKQN